MGALARQAGGEEIGLVDLVEELYDVPVTETPADDVQRAHAPARRGAAARSRRCATGWRPTMTPPAWRRTTCWRPSRSWRSACGERTRHDLGLPDGESIELVAVRDRPWGASAPYLGDLRTRVELNLDLPATLGSVTYLAAHEIYPGHHAERATKEVALWREQRPGRGGGGLRLHAGDRDQRGPGRPGTRGGGH